MIDLDIREADLIHALLSLKYWIMFRCLMLNSSLLTAIV